MMNVAEKLGKMTGYSLCLKAEWKMLPGDLTSLTSFRELISSKKTYLISLTYPCHPHFVFHWINSCSYLILNKFISRQKMNKHRDRFNLITLAWLTGRLSIYFEALCNPYAGLQTDQWRLKYCYMDLFDI